MRLMGRRSIAVLVAALMVAVGIGAFLAEPLYAQSPTLHPENVLNGDALSKWEALNDEYQGIFIDEVLPDIEAMNIDQATQIDAVGGMVAVLLDIQT